MVIGKDYSRQHRNQEAHALIQSDDTNNTCSNNTCY